MRAAFTPKAFIAIGILLGAYCLPSVAVAQERGAYVLSGATLREFAPSLYNGPEQDDLERWIGNRYGQFKTSDWVPGRSSYVMYRAMRVVILFGPFTSVADQQKAFENLLEVKLELVRRGVPQAPYVWVSPVFFRDGESLQGADLMALPGTPDGLQRMGPREVAEYRAGMEQQRRLQELLALDPARSPAFASAGDDARADMYGSAGMEAFTTALDKQGKDALSALRAKYGTTGGRAMKGNGMKGIFPVNYSFSKWFAVLLNTVLDALDAALCAGQCKDKIELALKLAYVIMPDVMDRIASTLAKIQDSMIPDNVENRLDKIAGVAHELLGIYQDLKRLHNMLQSGDFQAMLENASVKQALNAMGKAGLRVPLADKFCERVPCGLLSYNGLKNLTEEEMERRMKDWARGRLTDGVIEIGSKVLADIPVMKDLDLEAFKKVMSGEMDGREFTRIQAEQVGCRHVGMLSDACSRLVRNDPQGAMRKSIAHMTASHFNLEPREIEGLMEDIEQGRRREALRRLRNVGRSRYPDVFGAYADRVDRVLDDPRPDERLVKEILDHALERALADDRVAMVLAAQAVVYDAARTGPSGTWKGQAGTLLDLWGVDEATKQRIMNGDFEDALEHVLGSVAEKSGMTDRSIIALMKQRRFREAIEAQMEHQARRYEAGPDMPWDASELMRSWFSDIKESLIEHVGSDAYRERLALEFMQNSR